MFGGFFYFFQCTKVLQQLGAGPARARQQKKNTRAGGTQQTPQQQQQQQMYHMTKCQ